MDMLINRLYRTRVQIGYEPQNRRQGSPGKGENTPYSYAGNDAAELSPLSIVFYTTAKNSDGTFQDLSEKFSVSPFAQDTNDYGIQFKKTTILHQPAEKIYQQESRRDADNAAKTISETLNLTPQEASAILHFGDIAKTAYLQASQNTHKRPTQQMIDVVI
jgi:hypothetical protein